MPELPEVETVKNTLKKQILHKKIIASKIYWDNIIAYPSPKEFKREIKNQNIIDIKRRGKWLMFELNDYYLLSHLRMEGKYFIKNEEDELSKHEHVVFTFENKIKNSHEQLRYHDTRKFGKMYLLPKEEVYKTKPLKDLGLEPWDKALTVDYLKQKFKNKPIKTELLDQSIIVGIGNIYADEILFLSKINPLENAKTLSDEKIYKIIENTKKVLDEAIKEGGTTIKSYTSSEGVHGRFQNKLLVHTKDICPNCQTKIEKITVGGRGTYFCPNCQKEK